MRLVLSIILAVAGGAGFGGERPDIVVLLADDLGYADVGFNGGKQIKTPNIDKLADGGARLAQFYVQPVCSPTRAALMTGRYPMHYGLQVGVIRPWAQYGLPLDERLLPQALRESGYSTAMCGKWHLGSFDKNYWPCARGFEHHYGHLLGAIDYFKHTRDGKDDWWRDGEPCNDKGYSTHLLSREAVRIIQTQPKDKPLFLYVAFNAVHSPHQVPEEYTKPYADLKGGRRTYAGMLAAMDEGIGQILKALDDSGRRKNALIIFSSDNGGPAPGKLTDNGSLRAGKGTLYEGGVHVCSCVAWEGHIKPGVIDQPIHMVDWYPTLLKLAGAPLEQKLPIDGQDVLPVLMEGKPSTHTEFLLNSTPDNGALRAGDWKLVVNGQIADAEDEKDGGNKKKKRSGKAAEELFNLREDMRETKNLASEYPEKVKELRARYDALAAQAVTPKNGGGKGE